MDRTDQPIAVIPIVPSEQGICLIRKSDRVIVSGTEMASLIWKILSLCDGVNSVSAICDQLNTDGIAEPNVVEAVIDDLASLGALCDSREMYKRFHDISCYPTPYRRDLSDAEIHRWLHAPDTTYKSGDVIRLQDDSNSQLFQLQNHRRSVRSYTDRQLSMEQIGGLCQLGYGFNNHAVPSGGALYPLKLYVVARELGSCLRGGYYEYNHKRNTLTRYKDIDQTVINYIFSTSRPIFNAPVIFVIAVDLARQPFKYANRGYRLSLIEAGQVAQNITLGSIGMGLGSCELGGALDYALANELELADNVMPLLSIAVGYESVERWDDDKHVHDAIDGWLARSDQVVDKVYCVDYDDLSFYGATATIKDDTHNIACGVSTSALAAQTKAKVEAYERYISEHPRIDAVCRAKDLNCEWIDPRVYTPLTPQQTSRQGLATFDENLEIEWTAGSSITGKRLMVPSDLVYYGYSSSNSHILANNSSGIAAYTSFHGAAERAALELVERDALMRMWLHKLPPVKIDVSSLSPHFHKQQSYWNKRDRTAHFLAPFSQFAHTALVVIVGNEYPYFVAGAAAHYDFEVALEKALNEAEISLASLLRHPDHTEIDKNRVRAPLDHGQFYAATNHNNELSWIWSSDEADCNNTSCITYNLGDLLYNMRACIVDMSIGDTPIKVVRVLSSSMVPISFGYGCDHYMHRTLGKVTSPDLPHFFS